MPQERDQPVLEAIRRFGRPLSGGPGDQDAVLDIVGDADFVLLGEASHGTREFYTERAAITRRLIETKGFRAVAIEGDWPHARRVHEYVTRGQGAASAQGSLSGFKRFPTWMWRNPEVVGFVDWLRGHNRTTEDPRQRVGFVGLDLYSLFTSIDVVLEYLDRVDPEAARHARDRYSCFDQFGEDEQLYGYSAGLGLRGSCEDDVVSQLTDLLRRSREYASRDGYVAEEDYFDAEQNARLVRNAERYYRDMFKGAVVSWNIRDTHMAETLEFVASWLETAGARPKIVVWAHNSHLGDARATESGARGKLNLGQLVRERYGTERCALIGFSTYSGSVTAASDWGAPTEWRLVRPGLTGSYEKLFHEAGLERVLLPLRGELRQWLREPRLQRAIGVIYRPETERASHYFHAALADQFDAVLHFDETHALEPLEPGPEWHAGEVPETYPSAV